MSRHLTPERAVEQYLQERKPEVTISTYRNHKYALRRFVEWCDEVGLDDVSDLDGFHIHEFKVYRREHGGINEVTLYGNLCTLRVFVQWLEALDVVESGVTENMILPSPDDDARDETISPETADEILAYLDRYETGTLRHALFALLWDTGFRLGTAHALDYDDYHPIEQYVEVQHRPERGTPLKNKANAEREVNLHAETCEALNAYLDLRRHDVTDDHDRRPLFTSEQGRMVKTNLRRHITVLTRPCHYTGDCPHDRDQTTCEAAQQSTYATRCPSSISPHVIRRSAITTWLNRGHQKELLSDRMNVSPKTLDKHYDARTESEKRELRRQAFEMGDE